MGEGLAGSDDVDLRAAAWARQQSGQDVYKRQNLTGWAKRQTTDVLLNSVINPSAEIASGFNGTELKTKDGLVIQGLLLSEGDPLIVQSASGLTQMVPKGRVASRKGLGRSLMMSADQLGLSAQDLADINAFLKTQ